MKRSRAFILTEQLMTMLLQAGFILVLCMSFYMLTTFYAQTQQIMTARNHAERVISFVDNKIRYAGLGLWRCGNSETIAASLSNINMLSWTHSTSHGYRLPVSLKWYSTGTYTDADIPLKTENDNQKYGNVLTLLYAQRDLSVGGSEVISTVAQGKTLEYARNYSGTEIKTIKEGIITLIDNNADNLKTLKKNFDISSSYSEGNIKRYAVAEAVGVPIHLFEFPAKNNPAQSVKMRVYLEETDTQDITIPNASELMYLNCMQMFVHGIDAGEGRQFAYRELQASGNAWDNTYNQEKGILDIYMERDKDSNTFTLWVLATGGYDESLNNKRPETWPDNAHPTVSEWGTGDYSTYPHHIVYVSRASWKLNNLEGFSW